MADSKNANTATAEGGEGSGARAGAWTEAERVSWASVPMSPSPSPFSCLDQILTVVFRASSSCASSLVCSLRERASIGRTSTCPAARRRPCNTSGPPFWLRSGTSTLAVTAPSLPRPSPVRVGFLSPSKVLLLTVYSSQEDAQESCRCCRWRGRR
ncbi:hypothetical protein CCHR01_00107 [Colletotrichum chrysophilum]|uniref:Uncharacterized protein n=1 Tax=Colletotrichum chrysophilum TaxID=1836956 RepID=A0AAD9EUN4_9PEZI|nr:hypothetical protein CCHR01_00107 [Colletotrichum chrysophilum]